MKTSCEVFLVFDLETTGLKADKNAILEIACCPVGSDLKDLPEFESGVMKVYDDREVSDQALKANGITVEQIENGVDSEDVIKRLCKYLKSLSKQANKIIAVGHNIDKFDLPFLDDFFDIHGQDLSKYINSDFTIDTMWWSRVKWVESTNYKLGTCCQNCNIDLANAHRAINDTRANKELLVSFLSSLRGEGNSSNKNYKRPIFEWK